MEKRPKMKKNIVHSKILHGFWMPSIALQVFWTDVTAADWKHYKNTVKSNVLEGFTAFMAKNAEPRGRISYIYIYIYVGVGYRHWNKEKLKKTL